MMKKIKVALGLSGGVDSAVSAYLLKKQGFDVSCIYLNCYDPPAGGPGCRGDQDRKDALAVAIQLGLPFQVLDFRKQYKSAVIDYFKKEYLLGRTPNPDVVCNRDIKFGLFLDWAVKNGYDAVATGHYAKMVQKTHISENSENSESRNTRLQAPRALATGGQVRPSDNQIVRNSDLLNLRHSGTPSIPSVLSVPRDKHKDQTYFLWAVPRQKFSRVLFPLGNLLKSEVRQIAKDAGLGVADKKDSTGICFVGEVRVEDFLKSLGVKEKRGEVVVRTYHSENSENSEDQSIRQSEDQRIRQSDNPTIRFSDAPILRQSECSECSDSAYRVIGSHRGVWFYTIGQRHGFEITNWPPCHPERSEAESRDLAAGDKNIAPLDSSTSSLRSVARNDGVTDRPPLYVIGKDIKKNRLIVGFGAETYRDQFVVSDTNWLIPNTEYRIPNKKQKKSSSDHSEFPARSGYAAGVAGGSIQNSVFKDCLVRLRHGGGLIPCSVISSPLSVVGNKSSGFQSAGSEQNNRKQANQNPKTENRKPITVFLSEPQRGIAPGQSAVFYLKDGLVLGGGVIQ